MGTRRPGTDAKAAFERLKGLAGMWKGNGADGRPIAVSYQAFSAGTALLETWDLGPGRSSLTVYFLNGAELMAAHFCPQGNQPRLRMSGAAKGRLEFTFFDSMGAEPGQAVQQSFWIEIGKDGTLTRSETYVCGEAAETETVTYERG